VYKSALLPLGLLALLVATAAAAVDERPAALPSQAPQSSTASMATAAEFGTVEANIRAEFAKSFPTVKIRSVGPTPWPGVYEAVTPEGVFYADASGRYAINGRLVDVRTRANLTSERETELGRIDFKSLPFARAIKLVKGNGSRVFAVFADPDCPYCKRLEADLKDMDNVTVYTFLFPIDSLHPDATRHAKQIWCAKDPLKSWTGWVADRVALEEAHCEGDPIHELAKLGDDLQILGTPTIFLADGRRIPGYVPREQLERALDSVIPATTARAN
jgi:thiol:disulfide interchange protein DsbC